MAPLAPTPDLAPAPAPAERAAQLAQGAALDRFLALVRTALDDGSFASLVLSKNRSAVAEPRVVRVRRIGLRGAAALSFVHAHATRDVTRNLPVAAGLENVAALLDPTASPSFAHATLHAGGGETQLLVSRKGRQTLRGAPRETSQPPTDAAHELAPHDRQRNRRLPIDAPFLALLGITDERHRVVPAMARKWRQIDKFLEVLDGALAALPATEATDGAVPAPIRVVDYGCGKGYLTFAVHEHLRRRTGVAPQVTGVELRPELVDFCNGVAERAGCTGLRFVVGDLRSHVPEAVNVMIALHACDTATDHAIELGVRAGAAILVCSPCCHKELRPQLMRPRLLSGLLRHGVHLGQEAEMVTDSMRALLLETCHYDAQVFEFVSLEHTSKNKMILATKRRTDDAAGAARAEAELADLKSFYGIREQCLETLLGRRAAACAVPSQACQTP